MLPKPFLPRWMLFLTLMHYSTSLQTPRAQDWAGLKESHPFPSWGEFVYLATGRDSNWLKRALSLSLAVWL